MDPFTQKILDRAAQRSRHLGISDTSKFPITEFPAPVTTDSSASVSKEASIASASPSKNVLRFSSNKNKKPPLTEDNQQQYDNISVEINITTDSNVGVKCDVISMDVDEEGNVIKKQELINDEAKSIRDVSRSRLQRLGALYADPQNLSSPIHRTEARFCAEESSLSSMINTPNTSSGTSGVVPLSDRETPRPAGKGKTGKLAALADTINQWECDVSTSEVNKKPAASTNKSTASIQLRTPTKSAPQPKTPEKSRTPTIVEAHSKGAIKKTTFGATASSMATAGPSKSTTGASPKPKSLKWDKSVMDALESQGFQKRESQSGRVVLTYDKDPAHDSSSDREKENRMNESMSTKNMALRENKDQGAKNSPKKLNLATTPKLANKRQSIVGNRKDPAELSLRDRLAIFEKNKGDAILPKAPLALPIPANKANPTNYLGGRGGPAPPAAKTPEKKQLVPVNVPKATSDAPGVGIQSTISALMQGGSTISGQAISENVKRQREQEMDVLLNRFQRKQSESEVESSEPEYKIPAPPPPPPANYSTNKRRSGEKGDEAKRPKTNSQPNRLYPQLSDVDDTSSSEQNYTTASVSEDNNKDEDYDYSDSDSYDGHTESVAKKVMDSINKSNRDRNITEENHAVESQASTDEEDMDSEDDGMDDYLDEALENNTSTESRDANRRSISSNSFSYSKARESGHKRRSSSFHQKKTTPVESKMTLHEDTDGEVKLIHTVSFYRRQQSATTTSVSPKKTPKSRDVVGFGSQQPQKTYCDESDEESCMEEDSVKDDPAATQRKIKQLLDEVVKQQQIIGQTSQALNLCASTVEFSGSTESVEGERHLLVATHRRQAALNEIQRLRVEGLRRTNSEEGVEKGKITITEITLPLRQEYIRKLSSDTISGHHLVCLVKYGEHVFATRTVPTLPGLLTVKFPDTITLPEVYTDFKITLEIYGMTAQREVLPHDIKYHIAQKNKNKTSLLTPKGKKGIQDRLVMPPVQSPGGPNAVRTPGLVHYGFVIFSMKEVRRTSWTLNTLTSTSPLDGTVHMKIDCELSITVTHSGFLTMFEEVSGFGAWHRRWCRLQGPLLSFWKYPDDEKKKAPIGTLDLALSIGHVAVAPRDICARLNTLMLELKEDGTQCRYLLSSDTKEEREAWKTQFNRSITLLNSWSAASK